VLARIHLVRHGEVDNPGGIVYSDLPGFGLSALGRRQAAAAAEHLAGSGARVLVTSPLDRARETAGYLGRRLGLDPVLEPGLTEWGLSLRWAGVPWVELDTRFPDELAAYSTRPTTLPFSPESLPALAERMVQVVTRLGATHPGAVAVLVSHQDPIQALRLSLRGLDLDSLHEDKPSHAAVLTLEPHAEGWAEVAHWAPAAGIPFPPPGTAAEGGG
jgi:broad specificity phosphatase PhoE